MILIFLIILPVIFVLAFWIARRWNSRKLELRAAAALHQRPLEITSENPAVNSSPLEAAHWTFINEWHLEGQSDDRRPMNGSVAATSGTPSARRAFARRSHQVNYKKWSEERRE